MGVIYKARQISLNRIVAVKMILAGALASPEDQTRFHAEAEAAAGLNHPGIVPIYEVGSQEGQQYFSMAYVDGPSLAEKIRDSSMESRSAAELLLPICHAMQFAHEHDVAQRLGHLGVVDIDEPVMQPVAHKGLSGVCLALRDLVLVVRENVVDATGVHIERLAEILEPYWSEVA